jgi:hypothetical protein
MKKLNRSRGGFNRGSSPDPNQKKKSFGEHYNNAVVWIKENENNFLGKLIKFLVSYFVAFIIRKIVYWAWFYEMTFDVNPHVDFWIKIIVIFGAAAGLLLALNSSMKTKGNTTALALLVFLGVKIAQHYVRSYYDSDGKSKVFVNSKTGDIYLESEVISFTDIKTDGNGKRYFIHSVNGDTCWNDSPKNVESFNPLGVGQKSSQSSAPTSSVVYTPSGSPYTFSLKAGECSKNWFVIEERTKIWWELQSDNYEFLVFTEDGGPGVHGGKDLRLKDSWPVKFYVQALTDQVITLKIWRD